MKQPETCYLVEEQESQKEKKFQLCTGLYLSNRFCCDKNNLGEKTNNGTKTKQNRKNQDDQAPVPSNSKSEIIRSLLNKDLFLSVTTQKHGYLKNLKYCQKLVLSNPGCLCKIAGKK